MFPNVAVRRVTSSRRAVYGLFYQGIDKLLNLTTLEIGNTYAPKL